MTTALSRSSRYGAAPIIDEAAERVRAWDAGETVDSISMSGLGPRHEELVQVIAHAIVRKLTGQDDFTLSEFEHACDEVVYQARQYNLTVSIVGAAKNLALCLLTRRWDELCRQTEWRRNIRIEKPSWAA